MAEVTLREVTKVFQDRTVAVDRVDLEIADGELLVLVGPSGSGKTTVLRLTAGLEELSEGEIRIGGRVVNDVHPMDRDVAMVFQSYALYPHMTVADNIGFGLRLRRRPKTEIRDRVRQAGEKLALTDLLGRKPGQLSGGQRQRVAMGRAIVRDPAAFLMDEPLSNLDAKLRVQMRAEVSRLQQRLGTTTVYVTHDQTEAMTLGDRVAVMRLGVVQQVGRPQELYDEPVNLFVAGFIGSPSMNFVPALVQDGHVKLPMVDIPVPERLRGELQDGRQVIVGIRPEDMEDASLVAPEQRQQGVVFQTTIELLESMGSELYAHFKVGGDTVESEELRELAEDAGAGELPRAAGEEGRAVARLNPDARVRVGRESELFLETDKVHFFDPSGH